MDINKTITNQNRNSPENSAKYREFINNNRVKLNKYLNNILWFCILTGPAIAGGVYAGVFRKVQMITCLHISLTMLIIALVHYYLQRWKPASAWVSMFALLALEILLLYMCYAHVGIHLTWFSVPVLSLLFCDKWFYLTTVITNYMMMVLGTFITAPYYGALRTDFSSVTSYFINMIVGLTIETVVMLGVGYGLLRTMNSYLEDMFNQNQTIEADKVKLKDQLHILNSMAEIYDNVNLLNFTKMTEMSLREEVPVEHTLDLNSYTHSIMNRKIKMEVIHKYVNDFQKFTNIKTVQKRLIGKKYITYEFESIFSGWYRALYIPVEIDEKGVPQVIIYTLQNIDEDKKREEHLVRISMTDELTRLYNRRCFEEDLISIRNNGMEDDFVIYSVDVNGLKSVNDNIGHAAGDELIKGAADCMSLVVAGNGRVYRTGGDEYFIIAHTTEPEKLKEGILSEAAKWHGKLVEQMSISIGYATHKENPEANVDDLERLADKKMYEDKDRYYQESGLIRR